MAEPNNSVQNDQNVTVRITQDIDNYHFGDLVQVDQQTAERIIKNKQGVLSRQDINSPVTNTTVEQQPQAPVEDNSPVTVRITRDIDDYHFGDLVQVDRTVAKHIIDEKSGVYSSDDMGQLANGNNVQNQEIVNNQADSDILNNTGNVNVTLTKDVNGHRFGETVQVDQQTAERLVNEKSGVYTDWYTGHTTNNQSDLVNNNPPSTPVNESENSITFNRRQRLNKVNETNQKLPQQLKVTDVDNMLNHLDTITDDDIARVEEQANNALIDTQQTRKQYDDYFGKYRRPGSPAPDVDPDRLYSDVDREQTKRGRQEYRDFQEVLKEDPQLRDHPYANYSEDEFIEMYKRSEHEQAIEQVTRDTNEQFNQQESDRQISNATRSMNKDDEQEILKEFRNKGVNEQGRKKQWWEKINFKRNDKESEFDKQLRSYLSDHTRASSKQEIIFRKIKQNQAEGKYDEFKNDHSKFAEQVLNDIKEHPEYVPRTKKDIGVAGDQQFKRIGSDNKRIRNSRYTGQSAIQSSSKTKVQEDAKKAANKGGITGAKVAKFIGNRIWDIAGGYVVRNQYKRGSKQYNAVKNFADQKKELLSRTQQLDKSINELEQLNNVKQKFANDQKIKEAERVRLENQMNYNYSHDNNYKERMNDQQYDIDRLNKANKELGVDKYINDNKIAQDNIDELLKSKQAEVNKLNKEFNKDQPNVKYYEASKEIGEAHLSGRFNKYYKQAKQANTQDELQKMDLPSKITWKSIAASQVVGAAQISQIVGAWKQMDRSSDKSQQQRKALTGQKIERTYL